MQKQLITYALLFLCLAGRSQQVLNASGRSFTSGSLTLEWSLGEVSIQSTKTDYIWSTEGVLQPHTSTAPAPTPETAVKFPSLSSYGLDNAGTTFINTQNGNNVMVEFTLGETASRTLSQNNNMLTQGILQPYPQILTTPLPVMGLEFWAKRISPQQVQLDWKTVEENNNKGFGVERMKQNESSYGSITFVPSKAAGGNASLPLQYQYLDNNSYSNKTYYRLRQEDLDGKVTYSTVQVVQGSKGKIVKLATYPNPAVGEFSVLVTITSEEEEVNYKRVTAETIEIYDISGRLVQQLAITSGVPVKVSGLKPGTYLVKLKSETNTVQKVIVQ
jgi:hypothetical protein